MLNNTELPYWLLLNRCTNLGPRRFMQLYTQEPVLSTLFNQHQPTPWFKSWCRENNVDIDKLDWPGVEKDLNFCHASDSYILSIQDDAYPKLLKEIATPPPLLFVKGQLDVLEKTQIAMVGSRLATPTGLRNANQFATDLVSCGFTITSGLAKGIDSVAHQGALAARGETIAVLAHGLDSLYPRQHFKLAQQIIEQGALVSEFPIGTKPLAQFFPRRNRLVSGLSLGVLIVEAAIKSGSLITARYAMEQNREVFALPGDIHNPVARGCLELIRQGASCVMTIEDILSELVLPGSQLTGGYKESKQALQKNSTPSVLNLNKEAASVYQALNGNTTSVEAILAKTGLSWQTVSTALLALELDQWIKAVPGGYTQCSLINDG